jgi:hypothetical protein
VTNPVWYDAWRHSAVHELLEKNQRLTEEFQLGHWQRFGFDLDKGWLTFLDDGKPKVRAVIQVVGTVASGKNWLWAWGNDWWPALVTRDVTQVRRFGEENQIAELMTASLLDESLEDLGWELSAVAARIVSAPGAYRAPTEKGFLFVLFREVSFLT